MSAVGGLLSNVLTTAPAVNSIPLTEAQQEVNSLFDNFMKICLPEAECILEKKEKRSVRSGRPAIETKGHIISRFHGDDLSSDSGLPHEPSIISRSCGDEVPALAARQVEIAERNEEQINVNPDMDRRLHDAAARIAFVGDELEREYGSRIEGLESQLMGVIRHGADLSYEIFASTLNEMIGQNRELAEMALVMQLGKRIISQTLPAVSTISYFRQFVCDAFSSTLAQRGGIEHFIEDTNSPPAGPSK